MKRNSSVRFVKPRLEKLEDRVQPSFLLSGTVQQQLLPPLQAMLTDLQAAKDHGAREHAMFLFAVAHGARASEICNLRIADLNFKSEQVHIARLKGSLDSTQTLLRVKGSALFNETSALKAWLDVRKSDADDFVFNSQKAIRLSRITVYKLFRAIARAAGLPETLQHPHVLKHTAAMLMVRAGANAFLIRQHLGHRSFDSTLAYVNHHPIRADTRNVTYR